MESSEGKSNEAEGQRVCIPDWTRFPAQKANIEGVRVAQVSSGRTIHRFFDTSPFSPSGRYLAMFRFPQEDRAPRPGEAGDVVLVDLHSGVERVVAQSRGYEMQLGAQVQWGASDSELYFNDVDRATWQAFAVQLNPQTGQSRRMGGTVFMVSPDGTRLASYDLITSRRAQVGYGVIIPDEAMPPRQAGPLQSQGLYLTETATGASHLLVSLREIYEKSKPSLTIPNPDEFEYYAFQVKWNPQGTRLLTTIQWSPRADCKTALCAASRRRQRAVITMRPDGSELCTVITPEQWLKGGHHVNWMPDGERLSMNLDFEGRPGLDLISVRADGSDLKVIFKPGSGHPSMQPGGSRFIITDAYPEEPVALGDGTSPLRLIDLARETEQTVVHIFVSMTTGEFRVDPHPAWDPTGRFVAFNGFTGGTRRVFVADLSALVGK